MALAPTACGAEFDPASRVTDLRLIAVQADKPYAAPGERVELTTLSHEPFGRPLTWGWATCVKPDETTVTACLAKIAEQAQATGQLPLTMGQGLSSFGTTIPANVLDGVPAAAASNVLVGVLTVACPGPLSVRDPRTLAHGELPFRCLDASTAEELSFDRYVVSVKRIYVRRTERNANPEAPAVTWDGQPWAEGDVKEVAACKNSPMLKIDDCDGGERHALSAVVPPEAAESGLSELGVPFAEDVVVQYYASDGLFEFDGRTREKPGTAWAARASSAGKEQTLWFVVRENRGGVSWTTRRVRVRQAL
ncbi:MAG TPA: hypothetical protein VLT33_13505 [Labilithrix sp.]|nr:hypothetical protein [Labilithrix sp.]